MADQITERNDKLIMTDTSGPGIKEVDITAHNTVSDNQYQTRLQFTYLQEELAAYSVEGKKLHHLYCREIPKCSSGSTQDSQGRTLPLLSSLLPIFFHSAEFLGIDSPEREE